MFSILLVLTAVTLRLATAKVQPAPIPSPCGPNETYAGDDKCPPACPPICGDEFAGACVRKCGAQRKCKCKDGYVIDPRNNNKCVLRKDCIPPCIYPNEMDTSANTCNTACQPSCKNPFITVCTDNCVWRRCSCAPGYYLNAAGKCVPWKECPTLPDPCKNKKCPPGEDCVPKESNCGNPPCPLEAICIARIKPFDCSNFPCRKCNETCVMVQDDPNCKWNCNQHPECVPEEITCKCEDRDDECRFVPVTCVTCPCYPEPKCFPPCPANSSWDFNCKACEKTCNPPIPDPCIYPCPPDYDCFCDYPYLRDKDGDCVLNKDCPECK